MAFWNSKAHGDLAALAEKSNSTHLRELLAEEGRTEKFWAEANNVVLDYSRQKVTSEVLDGLVNLAEQMNVGPKIESMFAGEKINETEGRSVLHVALRAPRDATILVEGENVVPKVHSVLDRIENFSLQVRYGDRRGLTGKLLTKVLCIGIGGSYLGPEFVAEALSTCDEAIRTHKERQLRFLANVDPIDVRRALRGLDPETTLVVIVSKTFTTAETMLNARTVRKWLLEHYAQKGLVEGVVASHMCAVSTNLKLTGEFGIDPNSVFEFWDWVGGRFSVTSAVGVLPLSLHFGMPLVRRFLEGCHAMDDHFRTTPLRDNLPAILGLLAVWNTTYLKHSTFAVLPYCQALVRFSAHIQQLCMESNGKCVTMSGETCPLELGEIFFGEPGTNGQHSFYQLMHQGRIIPADFIGFARSQVAEYQNNLIDGHPVSNHDELMSNFFAQPDALAYGKTLDEVRAAGVPAPLQNHKVFHGDRPSSMILMPQCDAFNVGQLLAIYEHRTAVQGFMYGINSFDQWGVELGKVLATNVREVLRTMRTDGADGAALDSLPRNSRKLLERYFHASK
ncbi:MAG: uncharacterized protein KVP18_004080 [Porospora cf. gigantea A]|uniref:uncharacterized protein n=1 Tax=Porospora cf. gigantea A TaxID=2853593 RepID=UPI00355A9091|nr:MAG: hypothetical protein KVP18_004080 [Porospora cf. gigantea A]